jgi:hypothetical protein
MATEDHRKKEGLIQGVKSHIDSLLRIKLPSAFDKIGDDQFFAIYYRSVYEISVHMNILVGVMMMKESYKQCISTLETKKRDLKTLFERWTNFLVDNFDCVGRKSLSSQYFFLLKNEMQYKIHAVNLMYERMRLLKVLRMASSGMDKSFVTNDLRELSLKIKGKVVASVRPIHCWTQLEIVCTLNHILLKQKQLEHGIWLLHLLVLIEMRCSDLLTEVGRESVFNVPEYREEVKVDNIKFKGIEYYTYNYDFLVFLTLSILVMREKFELYSRFQVVQREDYLHSGLEGLVSRKGEMIRKFVVSRTENLHEGLNRKMKEEIGNSWGGVFDVKMHRYKFPASHLTRSAKYDELYPNRIKKRMANVSRDLGKTVREDIAEDRWIKEYVTLMVLDQWFKTNHQLEWYDRYVCESEQVQRDGVRLYETTQPMFVNIFSRYGVWFERMMFECANVFEAVALWMVLVETKCSDNLEGYITLERFRGMLEKNYAQEEEFYASDSESDSDEEFDPTRRKRARVEDSVCMDVDKMISEKEKSMESEALKRLYSEHDGTRGDEEDVERLFGDFGKEAFLESSSYVKKALKEGILICMDPSKKGNPDKEDE